MFRSFTCLLTALVLFSCSIAAQQTPQTALGEKVYQQRCAVCHDHPQEQIPTRETIAGSTLERIVEALTKGVMQAQGNSLSAAEKEAVARYLLIPPGTRAQSKLAEPKIDANFCTSPSPPLRLDGAWNGFSPGNANTRFQPNPGFNVEDIARLKPKWVFAYPGGTATGPPSIAGGRVFLPTPSGHIMSLDLKTGCTYWVIPANRVRMPITVQQLHSASFPGFSKPRHVAYYADRKAIVYAIDAETGQPIWHTKVDEHQFAGVTGALTVAEGRVYVPLTSGEGAMGPRGDYPCCSFRGSMVALDAYSGKIIWKSYTIAQTPKPFKLNSQGTQMYGPAGVGIWTPPTVDPVRKAVYGATAESKTAMNVDTSDALMGFDWLTGERLWSVQATANDNWIQGCEGESVGANCPDPLGPDADFATPGLIVRISKGRRALIAGQKSGWITAFDPDAKGKIMWRVNLAKDVVVPPGVVLRDRAQSGVVFGLAADDSRVYAAVADPEKKPGHTPLGVFALDPNNGNIVWRSPGAKVPSCSWGSNGCTGAQRTAVTAIPGALFAGSSNGHIRAYSANSGMVLWDFDTARKWAAVNGVESVGGSIEGIATVVAEGHLLVMSGFATFGGGRGNSLIAFSLDGK